ncbi:uncharacterized protein LOC123673294 [Harmonia axyridis]|uniref:uncharacterized protein LOC123673294 n=1 Tax=Harmonia axyridis TaxID=115357 RepID=UPI001E27574D|nr:uncharacterized protein LOC123673294 [Harmonia axyridis]
MLNETWLSSNISSSEICSDQYILYRKDRSFGLTTATRGGGVLVAVCSDSKVSYLDLSCITEVFHNIDIVGLKVTERGSSLYIFTIYIPPSSRLEQYEELFDAVSSLPYLLLDDGNLIILGDFNISEYVDCQLSSSLVVGKVEALRGLLNYMDLRQFNDIVNINGKLLDLVCCRRQVLVVKSISSPVPVDAHHPPLEFSLTLTSRQPKDKIKDGGSKRFNFRRANLSLLYDYLLNTNWDFLTEYDDINLACVGFYENLNCILTAFVPKTAGKRSLYPPWFTNEIIFRLKSKDRCRRSYKSTGCISFLEEFEGLRRDLKNDISVARASFCREAEDDLSRDPSKFWAYLNKIRGSSSVPGSMKFNGSVLSTPQDVADAFATFF